MPVTVYLRTCRLQSAMISYTYNHMISFSSLLYMPLLHKREAS